MNLVILRSIHFPEVFSCFIDSRLCFLLQWAHAEVDELHGPWQAEAPPDLSKSPLTHSWAPKRTTKDIQIYFVRVGQITTSVVPKDNFLTLRICLFVLLILMKWGNLGYVRRPGSRVLYIVCGGMGWLRYRQDASEYVWHIISEQGQFPFLCTMSLPWPQFCFCS